MSETNKTKPCPEIPYFGAAYPDARCIDGVLYDLDNCDEHGNPYERGEEEPCPFCKTEDWIEKHLEDDAGKTREYLADHVIKLREKYQNTKV